MAATRGSQEILCRSVIESLKLVKTLPNSEIRKGIDGVIMSLESRASKHKKPVNK